MEDKNYSNLDYSSIEQRIKTLRGNMQQFEFAQLFGITQQDVSKIENAKLKPSHEIIYAISVYFNKSIEWILTGQGSRMISGEGPSIIEPQKTLSPGITSSNSAEQNTADLLVKTAQILESDTIFRSALKSNIIALHEALTSSTETRQLNERMTSLEDEVKELRQRLR